jgi:anti-sigma regulatory factor (Ser/Thr protein kinase)
LKTIQGLHALDGVCEKCDPSVVAANILNLGELSQTPRLYIVLDFEAKLGLEHSVADNVKTAFLNLIVTELLINAIKFADANSPQVTISFEITPTRDYLKIHFVNNGLELKENEFEDVLGTVAMKPGEKRTALGLELNKRAAGILSWELQWIAPAVPGTHLELSIPYRD